MGLDKSAGAVALRRTNKVLVADRDEEVIPGLTTNNRNQILKFIRDYKTHDLQLDDARTAIAYTYSLIERTEEELLNLDRLQEMELARVETRDIVPKDIKNDDGKVTQKAYTEDKKAEDRERVLRNKSKLRMAVFGKLSKLAKTLVEQMEKQEKINVDKQKQSVISLLTHSSVLAGLTEAFTQALLREGLSEPMRMRVFKRFRDISREYPLVMDDMAQIHERLFGDSQTPIVDVPFTVVVDAPTSVEDAVDLMAVKRRKV